MNLKRIINFTKQYAYAAGSCIYLFTIGFFLSKNRVLISDICRHFHYKRGTKTLIPKIKLSKALKSDWPITLCALNYVEGNVSLIELMIIAALIKDYQPKNLFEIGTFDGRTTLNMAANCSVESKVYTLDLPRSNLGSTSLVLDKGDAAYIDKAISGARYRGSKFESKIVQLYGDSAKFDFSPFDGSIDFVFIDGSHAYEYALNDTRKALQLLSQKGQKVILWHDYGEWAGVTKALNELYLTDRKFKDIRHVDGTTLVYVIIKEQ